LRLDYGPRYFNLTRYYFFETLQEVIGKTIQKTVLENLYQIAETHCTYQTGAIKVTSKEFKKTLFESLPKESQILLEEWGDVFYETLAILSQKKAEYSAIGLRSCKKLKSVS
jgi:hypothetical protein